MMRLAATNGAQRDFIARQGLNDDSSFTGAVAPQPSLQNHVERMNTIEVFSHVVPLKRGTSQSATDSQPHRIWRVRIAWRISHANCDRRAIFDFAQLPTVYSLGDCYGESRSLGADSQVGASNHFNSNGDR